MWSVILFVVLVYIFSKTFSEDYKEERDKLKKDLNVLTEKVKLDKIASDKEIELLKDLLRKLK